VPSTDPLQLPIRPIVYVKAYRYYKKVHGRIAATTCGPGCSQIIKHFIFSDSTFYVYNYLLAYCAGYLTDTCALLSTRYPTIADNPRYDIRYDTELNVD